MTRRCSDTGKHGETLDSLLQCTALCYTKPAQGEKERLGLILAMAYLRLGLGCSRLNDGMVGKRDGC